MNRPQDLPLAYFTAAASANFHATGLAYALLPHARPHAITLDCACTVGLRPAASIP